MSKEIVHCKFDELINPSKLKNHPKNRNKHGQDQVERLAELYKYHGIRHPIIVSNLSKCIVAGHGRKLAAIRAGIKEMPVVYQDFESADAEYAFIQSDNAIALWAELDLSGINSDLADLGPDFDINMLGIRDFTLDMSEKEFEGDPDEVPEIVEPTAKLGQIYKLGEHRLMCGDSTNLDHLKELMSGEQANLWLTDPPYGVAYKSNGAEDKHLDIANDSMPLDEMYKFWKLVAENALELTTDDCPYYWFACQGGDQMMMMMSISDAGWKVRHELIWKKDRLVLSRCDYHYIHEPILYGWKTKGKHNWYSDRKQTSVLEFDRPKSSDDHPTMKPVALVEYLIKNSSKNGSIVLDTFNGSGTTLIACEMSGRKARTVELEPIYVDRTIARWEKFTGKKAELING
jgi:DNA modification methylase